MEKVMANVDDVDDDDDDDDRNARERLDFNN